MTTLDSHGSVRSVFVDFRKTLIWFGRSQHRLLFTKLSKYIIPIFYCCRAVKMAFTGMSISRSDAHPRKTLPLALTKTWNKRLWLRRHVQCWYNHYGAVYIVACRESDLRSRGRWFEPRSGCGCITTLGKMFIPNYLCASTPTVFVTSRLQMG